MNVTRIFGTIVICFFYIDCGHCFFEISFSLATGVFSTIAGSICHFKECCSDKYIRSDLNLLRNSLETELHDQHLAVENVQNALKNHINNAEPKKALAMSFHGSSGTGKNLMVNLIINALYDKGDKSNYVHYYNGYLDFPLIKKVSQYQHQVKEAITKHLGSCQRSIFIFDEVDHMPIGMLDAIIPFLDYNPRLLSVNPTQAIFIFVSNIGATSIEEHLIKMWQAGKKREESKLEDFESILSKDAFNEQGGFHGSNVIRMNFIDRYIPFLPFEKVHVKKCIEAALKKNNLKLTSDSKLSEMIIDEAMAHMTFLPSPHNLFSESGCKRVNSKVSMIVERRRLTNPFIEEN